VTLLTATPFYTECTYNTADGYIILYRVYL